MIAKPFFYENQKNSKIPNQNHENLENLIIRHKNFENHEIQRIPNHNHKQKRSEQDPDPSNHVNKHHKNSQHNLQSTQNLQYPKQLHSLGIRIFRDFNR